MNMATTMAEDGPRVPVDAFSPEDFETASIRSAAPSYSSDAPSYHSTNPHPDPLPPPYSPPPRSTPSASASATRQHSGSVSSLLDPINNNNTNDPAPRRYGLPPVPSGPPRQHSDIPSFSQFRIPPWSPASASSANPTARIYQNVALRRASAANRSAADLDGLMRRVMLERIEEEERNRVRLLEDPYLVGEEAAARARADRVARETSPENGDEILIREDRRWDRFLAQMKDREERERSWKRFRREADKRSNSRLAFRIGARF